MRLKVLAILVLLAVAGGAVALASGAIGRPAAASASSFLTATAQVTDVTDEVAATGSVEATDSYTLAFGQPAVAGDASSSSSSASDTGASGSTSVTWPVKTVKVAVGDPVTKGEVLATASASDLDAQISDATRAEKAAALQLAMARTNRSDATTTAQIRQTQSALYNAESAEAKAKADLAGLKAQKALASIVAPADGTVTAVNVRAGQDAPSGAAITMISGALRVSTNVVESDVTKITTGQPATVTVAALDATLNGTVASIDPVGTSSGSNGVVSYAVDVTLDAPPATLRPGMTADITIVTAQASGVVAIPSRALSGSAGAYTVRVVAADGSVSVRDVEVGLITSSLAEIKSGLDSGERVVTGTSSPQTTTGNGGGGFGGGGFVGGGGGVIRQGNGNP